MHGSGCPGLGSPQVRQRGDAGSPRAVHGLRVQDGLALEFASEEMQGDRELCTAAVAQNRLEALFGLFYCVPYFTMEEPCIEGLLHTFANDVRLIDLEIAQRWVSWVVVGQYRKASCQCIQFYGRGQLWGRPCFRVAQSCVELFRAA